MRSFIVVAVFYDVVLLASTVLLVCEVVES
jgi:hypothetical protein